MQAGMPNMTSGFKFVGTFDYKGRQADHWQLVETVGTKVSTYTFINDASSMEPLRYDMVGYDSLFGSHFDKYYIEYDYFANVQPDASYFQPPANLSCHAFPGPGLVDDGKFGSAEQLIQVNPMAEFVDGKSHQDKHHDEMFTSFKRVHGKIYVDEKEESQRKHLFRQNVRYTFISLASSLLINPSHIS